MEEIRFRCWDKERKKMTPSFPIWKCTGDSTGRYIFLQDTGLKDENKKRIYVGDIYEVTDGDGWVVGHMLAKMDADTLSTDSRTIGAVLGNVYENEYLVTSGNIDIH